MGGSFVNQLMAEGQAVKVPEVGMGATILMYTDRHAATVVMVLKNGTQVIVQEDIATRVDKNGMSDAQAYEYQPNKDGPVHAFSLRRNGRWVKVGESAKNGMTLHLGHRQAYHDYSF